MYLGYPLIKLYTTKSSNCSNTHYCLLNIFLLNVTKEKNDKLFNIQAYHRKVNIKQLLGYLEKKINSIGKKYNRI